MMGDRSSPREAVVLSARLFSRSLLAALTKVVTLARCIMLFITEVSRPGWATLAMARRSGRIIRTIISRTSSSMVVTAWSIVRAGPMGPTKPFFPDRCPPDYRPV